MDGAAGLTAAGDIGGRILPVDLAVPDSQFFQRDRVGRIGRAGRRNAADDAVFERDDHERRLVVHGPAQLEANIRDVLAGAYVQSKDRRGTVNPLGQHEVRMVRPAAGVDALSADGAAHRLGDAVREPLDLNPLLVTFVGGIAFDPVHL